MIVNIIELLYEHYCFGKLCGELYIIYRSMGNKLYTIIAINLVFCGAINMVFCGAINLVFYGAIKVVPELVLTNLA